MELKHVELFLAIVEQQNVTKAAEALFISQSTASYRLGALEKELNALLIDRGKGVNQATLTAKGRDFLPIAQRWYSLYKDTTRFASADPVHPLRIAASGSINTYILNDMFTHIARNEKKVNLIIHTIHSKDVYPLLDAREIDVAFTYIPPAYDNFKAEAVCETEIVFVEKSAARRAETLVRPQSLDPSLEVYVDMPSISMWHDNWFDPAAAPYVWVDTPLLIRSFLDCEGRWCVVTEPVARFLASEPGVHMYRLTEPPPRFVCYMVTHRFPKPSTVDALRILKNYLPLIP